MRLSRMMFIVAALALGAAQVQAAVKMPAIFGDHMVLQRDMADPVWGWADPGETITITAGSVKATATADDSGKWSAKLPNLTSSSQGIDLVVAGKSNTLSFHDVLVGDVWVCSGQSNMEFSLRTAHNAKTELPKADHPDMRLFLVGRNPTTQPQQDCRGKWVVCTPETAARFSAVGYFFGREIEQTQGVPVGLIATYWGGTPAQAWTSLEGLKTQPELSNWVVDYNNLITHYDQLRETYRTKTFPAYQKTLKQWAATTREAATQPTAQHKPGLAKGAPWKPLDPGEDPNKPTVLSNGMLNPIIPFAIKGAIWYQGESNTWTWGPLQYRTLFPTMIADWRRRWNEGDFPFIWVQLANFQAREKEPTQSPVGWPRLREAQSMTLKTPNTGQAVIIDIGQGNDIHPKDKLDVGHRLALAARHVAYGETLIYSGPMYDSMSIEGDKVRIHFNDGGSALTIAAAPSTQPGVAQAAPLSELRGFAIAGADHQFVWADAIIDEDSVIVSSPDVKNPVAVRYGWANNPEVNLYNKEGLPASPFRTDDWKDPAVKIPVAK